MTDEKDTGGQAFPFPDHRIHSPGMTLRDYFAAGALQGMHANEMYDSSDWGEMAVSAYRSADALIAERNKRGG